MFETFTPPPLVRVFIETIETLKQTKKERKNTNNDNVITLAIAMLAMEHISRNNKDSWAAHQQTREPSIE